MVVCLSSNEDIADEFELEITSSAAIDIKPNTNILDDFKHGQEFPGTWNNDNSGGSLAERTFTKNNFYLVNVSQQHTKLFIQLESKVSSPVGIYLFRTQKTCLNELNQAEINKGMATTMFVMKHNTLYLDCGNQLGNYMVVPCAYNRGDGAYKLKINSSKSIDVKVGLNKNYPVRKDYQIQTISCAQYPAIGPQTSHKMYDFVNHSVGDHYLVEVNTKMPIRVIIEKSHVPCSLALFEVVGQDQDTRPQGILLLGDLKIEPAERKYHHEL